jgi:hypothetical protein
MKFTIKHFFRFKPGSGPSDRSLMNIGSWDELRSKPGGNESFVFPENRGAWLRMCANSAVELAAADLARVLDREKIRRVVSVGVGRGCLEFNLSKRLPEMELVCTEYSRVAVERLRHVFDECKAVHEFDIRSRDWPWGRDPHTLVLLYRVDTEFDDVIMTRVMEAISASGIQNVLVVATGFAKFCSVLKTGAYALAYALRIPGVAWAGFLRSEERFVDILRHRHVITEKLKIGDLTGFFLKPDLSRRPSNKL